MRDAYIIIASQEYETANHKDLWAELANVLTGQVIIVNIAADQVVSRLKGKKNRVLEAKQGKRIITNNLMVVRPMFFVRPEILPNFLQRTCAKSFWRCIKKAYPEINESNIKIIVYDPCWVRILYGSQDNMRIAYYLYDELRYRSDNGVIDKKSYRRDEYACQHCDLLLTMSGKLAESRIEYGKKTVVVGNGASVKPSSKFLKKIENSVAFVGNFRDWIDLDLLEDLIKKRHDKKFIFIGPIQPNMEEAMRSLLNKNLNTFYYGVATKEDIWEIYRMIECVIVPYKTNKFMSATRPIKIVEAILAGTPVVTIPMNGYEQTRFIRYATDVESFSQQIDFVCKNGIVENDDAYQAFVKENTWKNKALLIVEAMTD